MIKFTINQFHRPTLFISSRETYLEYKKMFCSICIYGWPCLSIQVQPQGIIVDGLSLAPDVSPTLGLALGVLLAQLRKRGLTSGARLGWTPLSSQVNPSLFSHQKLPQRLQMLAKTN